MRFIAYVVALLVSSLALSACSSISGYKVAHNANGEVTGITKVKGLPIVVQNPTRALYVVTTATYDVTQVRTIVDGAGNVTTQRTPVGRVIEKTLSEKPTLIGPSEVYTIDPKRPFAGTLDYSIELDKDQQYPTKITGKLDDKTLDQFRQLAKDLAETAIAAAGAPGPVVSKEAGETVSTERTLIDKQLQLVLVELASGEVTIVDL